MTIQHLKHTVTGRWFRRAPTVALCLNQRRRTRLSRSLTRHFLLVNPYDNKKHFIDKTKKLLRHELRVSFFRQALAFHWGSCAIFGLVHLLYLNKLLQPGRHCGWFLLNYSGVNGIKIQMFLILTVGNNVIPQ